MPIVKTVGCVAALVLAAGTSAVLAEPLSGRPPAPIPAIARPETIAASPAMLPARSDGLSASALSVYTPPACVPGVPFADVTCTTPYDPWIEQFAADGITGGCGGGNYCPGTAVTRDQMAVFIERSMHGTAAWPPHTVLVYHHQMAETNSNLNSGTELINLVNAIPTTGPEAPGNGNSWLIKLGPGRWDLGTSQLNVPGYVSIEGSGLDDTVITTSTSGVGGALYLGPGVATLTRLTVQNINGTGTTVLAVQANTGRLILDRAEVYALGTATYQVGIYASDSAIELYNESGAYASGATSIGIYTAGTQYHLVTVHHAIVEALTNAISNAAGYEVDMAYGGVYDSPLANFGPGVFKCIGNYDRNEAPVTCP